MSELPETDSVVNNLVLLLALVPRHSVNSLNQFKQLFFMQILNSYC